MSQGWRVTLLRHAHADPAATGQSDLDRALSLRGEAEAEAAAAWLGDRPKPARVLCSPSTRTRQTAERVLARLGFVDLRIEPAIYDASPGALLDVLESHRDGGDLLLVGHNPGLESLVALLSTGQSGDHRGMPPAGIAELLLPTAAIEPGSGRVTAFWSP